MDGDWTLVNAGQMVVSGTEVKMLAKYGKADEEIAARPHSNSDTKTEEDKN